MSALLIETCVGILAVELGDKASQSQALIASFQRAHLPMVMELGLKNHDKDGDLRDAGIYGAALLGPPSPPTPWYPPSPPVVPCGVGSPLALPPCGRGRLPWLLLVGRPVAKGLDLRM